MNEDCRQVKRKPAQTDKEKLNRDQRQQQHCDHTKQKDSWQPMRKLDFGWILPADKRPALSEVENLLVKLTKRSTPFVIDKSFWYQPHSKSFLFHPDTELDILSIPIELKASG